MEPKETYQQYQNRIAQEKLLNYRKSEAQKGADAVRKGTDKFAKEQLFPLIDYTDVGDIKSVYTGIKNNNKTELAIGLGGLMIPGISGALFKKTIELKNILPKKFIPDPNAYYRMIGDERGLIDARTSGVIRSNPEGIFANRHTYFTKGIPNDKHNPILKAGAKKGTFYEGPYMVEIKPGEFFPENANNLTSD